MLEQQVQELLFNIKDLERESVFTMDKGLSYQDLLKKYIRFIADFFEIERVSFFLFNKKTNSFKGNIAYNKKNEFKETDEIKNIEIFLEKESGLFKKVSLCKKSCFTEDVNKADPSLEINSDLVDFFQTKTFAGFPLVLKGNVEGLIIVDSLSHGENIKDNMEYIQVVVEHILHVVADIKLSTRLKKALKRLDEHKTLDDIAIEPKKILIALLDEEEAKILRNILMPHGHEICISTTDEDALVILTYEKYDVLLVDKDMFELHGVSFKQFLQAKKVSIENFDIDVIVLANIDKLVANFGVLGIIPKPFDRRFVLGKVNKLLVKDKN